MTPPSPPPRAGPTSPSAPAGSASAAAIERDVLDRITPSPAEEQECQRIVAALVAATDEELARQGVHGKATVQGSVAKHTWLAGSADIDLFILVDPAVPAGRLETIALDAGKRILTGAHTRYAQHPYLIGTFEGRTVDLVPAYRVAQASAKMSAVDRTPFHTAWVAANLDAARRDAVRLLKRFLKGTGCYGAQTATGGFSGYLAEVLVAHFGSLHAVLDWLAKDAQPRRIAIGPDQVLDDVAELVVVDPVDPARNCAAAVQADTLRLACDAARAYRTRPAPAFFFPAPPRAASGAVLADALRKQSAVWLGLVLHPRTDRLDIVFPQFQKAARTLAAGLADAGFRVHRMATHASPDEKEILTHFIADAVTLPPTRRHAGPLEDGRPNAARFREKWETHPDAAGPVRCAADGHLELDVRVAHRTAQSWLTANHAMQPVGRHVQEAMADSRIIDDPAAAPPQWAARVADLVLDRRPWDG